MAKLPSPSKKNSPSILEKDINIGGTGLRQRAIFAKHLSIMLKSGITISEALEIVESSLSGKFKKIIGKILKSVQSGQSLSASFSQYPKIFSGIFAGATYVGEKSGTLSENLENVAIQLEKENNLKNKVKGAMLYPVIVLIAAFCLGLAITFFILPKILPLFKGLKVEFPLSTKILIWFSSIMESYGVYIFLVLSALAIILTWLARQKFSRPVTHWILLKLPLINKIIRQVNLSQFCGTLGMLLKSGLTVDEALRVAGETTTNYYYQKSINEISKHIDKGTTISDNLKKFKKLYPAMLVRMIMVGEKSGKLEETLFYLANFYETEVDNETKTLSTTIEPALLIMIGLVVGFLVVSIITPIYGITSGMSR